MNKQYFFYIGNAYPHKNLDRLVGAMVLLNKDSKEKSVLKIGSARNVFVKRLENTIKKYKAQKYVELLGFVPEGKIISLYKNSVAFVFPTLAEGFGLPGLEAMQAGTLVAASKIPVLSEVYRGNAIYFDPLSTKSIADTLKGVLKIGSKERKERIEKAQKFAKRYSWEKMAKETLAVYNSVT